MNRIATSAAVAGTALIITAAPAAAASIPVPVIGDLTARTTDTTIDCAVPNHVECRVSDPDGIRRVVVTGTTGTVLVDEGFPCVSPVTVGWDSAYPSRTFKVQDCSGPWIRMR
ncbi:hypothetical protein [Blastococcus mobilis]|uniref:Alpha amylase inhibitor n=1 Tax=Blastococcus mobilis TaxID=1938746 RepID=A0A238ZBW9_9ACTN|nr:hypothetical protein [Blastococcus mobilis]SNR80569.1 hypothetical protein SAMN06272737_1276 [Blastococcus mobilis]